VNPHFRGILSALSAEGAEFLVVGAYALAVHGLPRATGDLDIWVRPSAENAERVWRALVRFGAPLSGFQRTDFTDREIVCRMGLPPSQIDLLTSISGVEFETSWPNRLTCTVEGVEVFVIGVADQIQNKRSANRPKDHLDADWLEQQTKPPKT
jgi:hypothetical protein